MTFELKYAPGWDVHFAKFDKSIKLLVWNALGRLETKEKARHLHNGLPYLVEEAGQYRITFKQDNNARVREIYFVGDHKQYEKWLRSH